VRRYHPVLAFQKAYQHFNAHRFVIYNQNGGGVFHGFSCILSTLPVQYILMAVMLPDCRIPFSITGCGL